jgi:hypothetical protein
LVISPGNTDPAFVELATSFAATQPLSASNYRYETEQILQFITENTTDGEHAHRPAALPTAAACAASDEMMRHLAVASKSLFVLGFYDDGTEL